MTRPYQQAARAEAKQARITAVLDAFAGLLLVKSLDATTLQMVADRSGVSLPTIVRSFRTKERLLEAVIERARAQEEAMRETPPAKPAAAIRVLVHRYEAIMDANVLHPDNDEASPSLVRWRQVARRSHLAWLEAAFAPWLPRGERARRRHRLLALFGATELYTYWTWRRRLDIGARAAEQVMLTMVLSLCERWEREDAA